MTKKKHHVFSFVEAMIMLVALFVGIAIFLPFYIAQHKSQNMDKNFYQNKVISQSYDISNQKQFWDKYNVIMNQRADVNGNGKVSVEEKEAFDKAFFGGLNLTVDPATQVITNADGTVANPKALLCHLNNFYPQALWIKPVCPAL
jgi:hypothetical protein